MYFPFRGSQTTIWLLGSKHLRKKKVSRYIRRDSGVTHTGGSNPES